MSQVREGRGKWTSCSRTADRRMLVCPQLSHRLLKTNEGDRLGLRWKPDLSPEAIFKKPVWINYFYIPKRSPKSRGKINSRGVSFTGGVKVLLNSLGNNRKYSMICANWYEITHSALSAATAASALCQLRFFLTAWKQKYTTAEPVYHLWASVTGRERTRTDADKSPLLLFSPPLLSLSLSHCIIEKENTGFPFIVTVNKSSNTLRCWAKKSLLNVVT